jgi:hypothetical protein
LFFRKTQSVLALNELFDLYREVQNRNDFLPKSGLGQAVAYALNNETALRQYCDNGWLAIDNNVSERAVKPFVQGRKNWLFFGSPAAAKRSSVIMTVLASANRNGLNELEYPIDVLYRLPKLRRNEYEQLLPDRWVKSDEPPTAFAAVVRQAIANNGKNEINIKTGIENSVMELITS